MIGITTTIVLDTRTAKKDGTFAVKLRITYNREQKYYPVNIHLKSEDWAKTLSTKPRKELRHTDYTSTKLKNVPLTSLKIWNRFHSKSFKGNLINDRIDQKMSFLISTTISNN